MPQLSCEAILLRAVDFGESDRIAHLLTPEVGRLTVIAKGARRSVRRFPGTLDVFNHLRVTVRRRPRGGLAWLEQAVLRSAFLPLRERVGRYALASYLVEILDRMAPESGSRLDAARLFAFALAALRMIEASEPDRRLRLLVELRAFDALGLRPELSRCVRCGRPPGERARFLVADGGVVCDAHSSEPGASPLPVHLGTLRALEQALDCDWSHLDRLRLGPDALAEAERLLFRFHRFHLGVELRSERFLDEVLRGGRLTPPTARVDTPPPRGLRGEASRERSASPPEPVPSEAPGCRAGH